MPACCVIAGFALGMASRPSAAAIEARLKLENQRAIRDAVREARKEVERIKRELLDG